MPVLACLISARNASDRLETHLPSSSQPMFPHSSRRGSSLRRIESEGYSDTHVVI